MNAANSETAGAGTNGAPESKHLRGQTPWPISDHDVFLFKEGTHYRLYDKLGTHLVTVEGEPAVYFAVWAPNAEAVSVIGDFNGWNSDVHRLQVRGDGSGIWEGVIRGIGDGALYKYRIRSRTSGYETDKSDPFAFSWQRPPATASRVSSLAYQWGDHDWMTARRKAMAREAPVSIYEVHLGSWRRIPEQGNRPFSYRELAQPLADYVQRMGFTHVEFLPLMEHPFYGSWGYQITGYFAPSARYGTPQDLMFLVDYLHQRGIGVIFDWVPSHFPNDAHGLVYFDGTHLFEHADPRQGYHPEWNSCVFNYGRHEVRAFLMSSALFWLDKYHVDGLRIDGVASMLYLDYARKEGEWIPNEYGGREDLHAVHFLRRLNEAVYRDYPDVQTIAEESTAWPMVTRPTSVGGLGFGYKWNMGWMHDMLRYMAEDPVHRKYHHDKLAFTIWYAFTENFILPLSHDEVVHGKGSLIGKMPGDEWQKFANLRLLYGYMWAHPGKKLLFMGGEFAQYGEWRHDESLDWNILDYRFHRGVQDWTADLNRTYRAQPALHEYDCESLGFEWVEWQDRDNSVLSFLRMGRSASNAVLVVCNFTPVVRAGYRVGVPCGGWWEELLNSDADAYGGSGVGNAGGKDAERVPHHGREWSLRLNLPPLGVIWLKGPSSG
ncbi:MAG TPA: 1,4-alpha-glucan branching protein GlgB [Burkholderiales bacterium]|nr:1,4-alpha-glucan branching protein GlgB [Burkholderiales bacterium]